MIRPFIGLLIFLSICQLGCDVASSYTTYKGKTMGTDFTIIYQSRDDFGKAIDALLRDINQGVSTYISDSDISKLNRAEVSYNVGNKSTHLTKVWDQSVEIHEVTNGYFDPTSMPLVNFWGFGYRDKRARGKGR